MQTLVQDLRYGLRALRKSPGFALSAVLVLALGIGANTAIFSVVNAVLLRPLPFHDPERLVQIWHVPPQKSFPGMTEFAVSPANYFDWQAQNHVFQKMAIYGYGSFNLTGSGEPVSVSARRVSASFFPVLEVQPMLGRVFSQEEDRPGHNHVAILNESFWRSQFGADPQIVGKTITLDGEAYTVVGVMAAKFEYPPASDPADSAKLWVPFGMTDQERAVRGNHNDAVIARLRDGVSLEQAQAEMNTISLRLQKEYPADDNGWGAVVKPTRDDLVGDVRPALLVLLGAVAFVLLIACANVANLVLARTISRQKEIAVRAALGATRRQIVKQVLAETVLLSIIGAALGLILAHFGLKATVAMVASRLPRASGIGLDLWVLLFTLGVAVLSGFISGLWPAYRLSNVNVNYALKQGSRTSSDAAGHGTRGALVIVEVALSLMLLIGAGLMIRSLWMLRNVNPGFDPHNVLALVPSISRTTFPNPQQEFAFADQVLQRIRALPGVKAAGTLDALPLEGGSTQPVAIEGRPVQQMADQPEVAVRVISPGLLHAMSIPLLRGRDFGEQDKAGNPGTILISQSMANRFWPNEDPIGKHLTLTFFPGISREIVGVVGDVKNDGLDAKQPSPTIYTPLAQLIPPQGEKWRSYPMWVVVKTSSDPRLQVSAVRDVIHDVNASLPVRDVTILQDFVANSLSQQRFNMVLLACFACLALVLAAIGIYSVLAYSVRRRVREIGIRMALGAQIGDVLRLVVSEGMKPTLIGLGIGIAGALALGRVLSSMIYGIKATDLATFASVAVILLGVGLLASLLPAYRATRIEPVRTLREE